MVTIKIVMTENDRGNPAGKLADAEVHFTDGPLAGLKLIGFQVWERHTGERRVTFPARTYSVNGERRSFVLLRPMLQGASVELSQRIIDTYDRYVVEQEST